MDRKKVSGNVFNILKDAEPAPKKEEASKTDISVSGQGNIVSGGDITIDKNIQIKHPSKTIIRKEFTPGPEHISAEQAKKLKDIIDNLVKKEVAAGNQKRWAYAYWWGRLKNRYDVSTYKEIPARLGDEAVSWLKQQSAIKRSKIRRNDKTIWRKELYGAIWARSRQLNLSKGEVYNIVYERMEKRVSSLTQLGEQNLKKLYNIIMAKK